jgi:Ca-activated chloride channel family protein
MLAREDFKNDQVDAGDIGAGHRVTALYEIIPVGAHGHIDPLRYGSNPARGATNGEIANVRVRYKMPGAEDSRLLEYPVARSSLVSADKTSPDLRFAASVAAFGQRLRGGKYLGDFGYEAIETLARGAMAQDSEGYRREFVSLVKLAASLSPQTPEQVGQVAP